MLGASQQGMGGVLFALKFTGFIANGTIYINSQSTQIGVAFICVN